MHEVGSICKSTLAYRIAFAAVFLAVLPALSNSHTLSAQALSPTPPLLSSAAPVHPFAFPTGGLQSEEEIRTLLQGRQLWLRGWFLDNSLSFNEHGGLVGNSPRGSWTLAMVEISHLRLTRHRLILEGNRYGLHFLDQRDGELPGAAVDRVLLTSKKKPLRITIDREQVSGKESKKEKRRHEAALAAATNAAAVQGSGTEPVEAAADPASVTTTASLLHAAHLLEAAIDAIFAPGLDEHMMVTLPAFWRLYYQAALSTPDSHSTDPQILRQNHVERKARLLSSIESPSNEFAQNAGVAGMASYHVVVDASGKPGEITVARPIGFGLDENAVDAIRRSSFEPAQVNGRAVPVQLDLVVQFRIYSRLTSGNAHPPGGGQQEALTTGKPSGQDSRLPGPYSLPH